MIIVLFGNAANLEASDSNRFQVKRIAHAGGGLGKKTYTNSFQALDMNMGKGFRYFELDFSFTSDGQLVCIHDWSVNFMRTFEFEIDQPPSLKEFERLVADNVQFSNCTLKGLALWMSENSDAYIVTDLRIDNLKALKIIREMLPDSERRVIPQIYQPQNYASVKRMGYEQVIWTLYQFAGTAYDVIDWTSRWAGAFAITMPKSVARSSLPKALKARGIPTYVHTVNSVDEKGEFVSKQGVSEIYTDFLIP